MKLVNLATNLLFLALVHGVKPKPTFAEDATLPTLPGVEFAFDYSSTNYSSEPGADIIKSWSEEIEVGENPSDFVFANGDLSSEAWLATLPGYSGTTGDVSSDVDAAGSRILYQKESWSMLEDGTQHDNFESSWARFKTVNTAASSLSICTMVVEWHEEDWSEAGILTAAIEVEARLKDQCDDNDTIALSFTGPVSTSVTKYLEGEEAASSPMAPLTLLAIHGSMTESPTDNRVFIRLADSQCIRNVTQSRSETLLVSLSGGVSCPETTSSRTSSEDTKTSSDDDSDWDHDLKFIIPICCCVFFLGCAALVHVLRQKKSSPESETPKDEKEITASLPYVLTLHSAV